MQTRERHYEIIFSQLLVCPSVILRKNWFDIIQRMVPARWFVARCYQDSGSQRGDFSRKRSVFDKDDACGTKHRKFSNVVSRQSITALTGAMASFCRMGHAEDGDRYHPDTTLRRRYGAPLKARVHTDSIRKSASFLLTGVYFFTIMQPSYVLRRYRTLEVAMNAMQTVRERFRTMLPNLDEMADADIRLNLLAFHVAIGGNFQAMMMFAYGNARSQVAKDIGRENLLLEVSEDHPRMLDAFCADLPYDVDFTRATDVSERIHDVLSPLVSMCQWRSTSGHWIIALFENLSLEFIPWMAAAAERLQIEDRRYVEAHGEADIAHAVGYVEAFMAEVQVSATEESEIMGDHYVSYTLAGEMLTDGREATFVLRLLDIIFNAHRQPSLLP